jgi:transcriptional regulator with XRE-family HTH domain
MQARVSARNEKRLGIAVQLATIREKLGLTQSAVAAFIGVPLHVVNEAEKAGSLSVDRLEALLEGYRAIDAAQTVMRERGQPQRNGATRAANIRARSKAGAAPRDIRKVKAAS